MCYRLLSIVALAAGLCTATVSPLPARTLTVGAITAEPAREFRIWNPLVRYLAARLEDDGVTTSKFVTARDSLEMARLMRNGAVDLFIDSALVALTVNESSESVFFLRKWKEGQADCHSVIFARADNTIDAMADLPGRRIAFTAADSSSSYIVPRLMIEQAGLRLVGMTRPGDKAPPEAVGFVFSGTDENTIFQVLAGHVDVGAVGAFEFRRIAGTKIVRVIAESESLPCHVMSHRKGLPAAFVERIRDVLLGMDRTEAGRAALNAFDRTTRFTSIAADEIEKITSLAKSNDAGGRGQ